MVSTSHERAMSAVSQCARGVASVRHSPRTQHQKPRRLSAKVAHRPELKHGFGACSSRGRFVLAAAEPSRPVAPTAPVQQEEEEEEKADVTEKTGADQTDSETLRLEGWGKCRHSMKANETVTILLTKYNWKGFSAKCHGITGFIPFSKMDPTNLPVEGSKDAVDKLKALLGTYLSVKIVHAEVGAERLIFSQLAVKNESVMKELNPGAVMDGVVTNVTDYGAFVTLKGSDGQISGVTGLVHKSELSWEMVTVTSSVVKPRQEVKVKLLSVDRDSNRISLSIRQCMNDPLTVNLDNMMPAMEDGNIAWQDSGETLPGLDEICSELRAEEGVLLVTPGRQAEVSKVVSQDLQIFMTKEQVFDGFNLVARSGNKVQEVHVATDMSREEMVKALTKTLQRVSK